MTTKGPAEQSSRLERGVLLEVHAVSIVQVYAAAPESVISPGLNLWEELLKFIKEQHAELSGRKAFSFMDGAARDAKKEPWKQRNPFERLSSQTPSCVFVNLGRIKSPHMRLAIS
eukprot:g18046.t1